jgi:molybdopterin/thiamine biosynthesis adenylyltransferase
MHLKSGLLGFILGYISFDRKPCFSKQARPYLGMAPVFDYHKAFSRNLGWVTPEEQERLRGKRIAIAGLGGVGGVHLLTLARLGVGKFTITDLDTFELTNFNRQVGALVSTLQRPKVDTLLEMAKDINPELDIRVFPKGVAAENVVEFLTDVDLYVDSLDFFAFSARETVFPECYRRKIPAIIAGPVGMGVGLINFLPGRMTFEQYFRWAGQSEREKAFRFLLGLAPAVLQRAYIIDRSRVNLDERRVPSTGMSCELCAGVAGVEALKILLNRGQVLSAPWGLQFDAYRYKMVKTWRPWGNRNPLQQLSLAILRRQLKHV